MFPGGPRGEFGAASCGRGPRPSGRGPRRGTGARAPGPGSPRTIARPHPGFVGHPAAHRSHDPRPAGCGDPPKGSPGPGNRSGAAARFPGPALRPVARGFDRAPPRSPGGGVPGPAGLRSPQGPSRRGSGGSRPARGVPRPTRSAGPGRAAVSGPAGGPGIGTEDGRVTGPRTGRSGPGRDSGHTLPRGNRGCPCGCGFRPAKTRPRGGAAVRRRRRRAPPLGSRPRRPRRSSLPGPAHGTAPTRHFCQRSVKLRLETPRSGRSARCRRKSSASWAASG